MDENVNIFKNLGVEVKLKSSEDFLKVKETLTRIGIPSKKEKKIWQSVHILHKKGRYIICHFKEMFILDGKSSDLSDDDIARRNRITVLLEDWGLLSIVDRTAFDNTAVLAPMSHIKIIAFKEKDEWECIPKYNIGNTITDHHNHK